MAICFLLPLLALHPCHIRFILIMFSFAPTLLRTLFLNASSPLTTIALWNLTLLAVL
uniref:Uncharacterized protein n=1 Tax=Arundo donax TaxID=35708 RepID=A0A0A8ZES3_ARUDO